MFGRAWSARYSHRTRILAVVLASGLPVLLLAVFGLWRYLDAAKQEIVDDRVAMAQSAAITTQAFVTDVASSTQTLALTPELTDPGQRGLWPTLLQGARQANPEWQSIAVLNASGQALATSGTLPQDTNQLRSLLQAVTASDQVEVATVDGQSDGGASVLVGAPLTFDDGTRGILLVSPSIRVLSNELRAQARGSQLGVAVTDLNSWAVLVPAQDSAWLSNPQVQASIRGDQAAASQVNTSSGPLLMAYAPVANVKWVVVIGQPTGVAFASLEHQVTIALGAIVLALGAAGLMAWVLGGRLSVYYERVMRARDRAEEAIAGRDEVLASVSHDLQNPIAAAKGYLQLIQRRMANEPEAPAAAFQHTLRQTERAVTRMQQMTEELVDSARLRAGYELALRPALTDLVGLVHQVIEDQSAIAESHRIHVGAEEEELWVACDPARISRVISNLLSNAVKYSPVGSQILIELRREDDALGQWAALSICDEGIGIPKADLPELFERFHRAGNALTHAGGTGLGLTGTRSIVQQHGGNLVVESQEGVGTTVRIRLPRSVSAVASAPAAVARSRPRRLA